MKKTKRKKSIASSIHTSFVFLAFAIVATIGTAGLLLQFGNNIRNAEDNLSTTAKIAAERYEWAVQSYQNSIKALGLSSILSDDSVPVADKKVILDRHADQFGFTRCQVLDQFGYSITDGIYRGNRDYFTAAMAGKIYISDPIVSRTDGNITIVVAAPLWKDGLETTEPIGVVWGGVPPETINTLVSSLEVSKHSYAFILGQTGNHVASSDSQQIMPGINTILQSVNDPSLAKLAAIERQMINGIPGKAMVVQNGIKLYAWEPIGNTPGWTLALQAPLNDYLSNFWLFAAIILLVNIATFYATRLVAKYISRKVGQPVHQLADQLNRASLGDLNFDLEEIGDTEDVHLIAEASKNLVLRLNNTLTFVDSYKTNTTLSDFLDATVIKQLTSFYEEGNFKGFHLIIMDNKGEILTGQQWVRDHSALLSQTEFKVDNRNKPLVSPIMIDGRIFGSVGYYIEEGGPITRERADGVRDMVSHVLALIGQTNFNRNVQNITRIKNLQDNIQNLVEMETATSIYLQQLLFDLKTLNQTKELFKRMNLLKEIQHLADSSLESINRAVDYSLLNDLNAAINEVPYSPQQLSQQITLDGDESGLTRKATISVQVSEAVPGILYGDLRNISRAVHRIISDISQSDRKSFVSVLIDARTHSYSTELIITISNPRYMLSSSQLQRCNAYLAGDMMALGTQSTMSNTSLHFLSIVRIVHLINGTLELKTGIQQGTAYVITLPQVSLNKEGRK